MIEKGIYSDRFIVGVVTTEEQAKEVSKAVADYGREDEVSYTEFDTDQFITKQLRFKVREWPDEWQVEYDDYDLYEDYKENTMMYEGRYIVYAKNKEQAIKIAQDMKAEYLAEKNGVKL